MGRTKTKEEKTVIRPKIIEADAPIIIPDIEEKIVDEDSPVLGTEDEETEETVTLDEEELNPFGDKWEQ
jgi:hypothetical protein